MTSRERLLAALNGKTTDRLPYAPLLSQYYFESLKDDSLKNIVSASAYIGSDILKRHCPCIEAVYNSAEVRDEIVNGVTRRTFTSRLGSVSQESYWKDGTMHSVKRCIASLDDLKIMTDIYANVDYIPNYDAFAAEEKIIGDAGLATADGPMSPLLYIIQHLSTLEDVTYLMYDEADAVEEFFQIVHESNLKYYKLIREMELNCVMAYEDTSTSLISRDWMKKYAVPTLNEYAKIMADSPNRFIVHMCGKLQGFKDDIRTLTCDGFDSLCPPSTGDTCIWNARNDWPDKCLIGGIDPVAWKYQTPVEILNSVKTILLNLKNKTGFILCSGDSVAAGTPIDNLKIITEFIKLGGAEFLKTDISESFIDECLNKFVM